MNAGVFSEYIRALSPRGDPPDQESFERVWRELRRRVARELKRKGLWDSSPAHLGISGDSWIERGASESATGAEDALHELVTDCYVDIFFHRLPRMAGRLKNVPSVDPMVVRNIRNLLRDKQKANDRLGYRIFGILRAAVERAVEKGELFVLQGGEGVLRNDTLLGFDPDTDPARVPPAALEEIVERWNDMLLPELLESRGKKKEWVVTSVRTFISRLPRQGVAGFRFRELIDPLKQDVRIRRAAQFELQQGEAVREGAEEDLVRMVPADTGVEERESFEKFLGCMARAMKHVEAKPKVVDSLRKLWGYLLEHFDADEKISQRKIAEELNIPRKRLPELYGVIRRLSEACGGTRFAGADVRLIGGTIERAGGAMGLNASDWAGELRQRTGEARRRYAGVEVRLLERSAEPPKPGDVFFLAATEVLAVDWVVLELDPDDPKRLLAVPADDNALVGSADLSTPEGADCGLLVLRCAFGAWLDAERFDPEMRMGSVPLETVEGALRKWRRVEEESLRGSDEEQEVEEDAEYREWREEVLEPARAAVMEAPAATLPGRAPAVRSAAGRPPARPRPRRRGPGIIALAASVLLGLGLGLGGGLLWLQPPIEETGKGNVPFRQIRLSPEATRSEPAAMTLPPEADEVFFLINVFELSDEAYERYRLEVLRKDTEEEVWRSGELVKITTFSLTVVLPTSLLPSGEYLLRLYGMSDEERADSLAEHVLIIDYE